VCSWYSWYTWYHPIRQKISEMMRSDFSPNKKKK
jgi:hypothetical protein